MREHGKMMAACALLLALALCLTACGSQETPKAQETEKGFVPRLDPQISGSVTVAGHYSNFEALEAEFNRFAQYYPNVQLTYTYMDGYSKSGSGILSTALASGEAPDIFFTYPYMDSWPDGAEILAASEDLADPALGLDLGCIRPELLKKDAEGRVFSVPFYTTTYGMLVNEDLFAKENIAVPQTYEELVAACEALQKAGYASPVMGYSRSEALLYPLYYPYFCGQIKGDAEALAALNGMGDGAAERARGALALTADFAGRGFIRLPDCDALENNYEAVILRFFEGDVPMMLATGNTVSGTEKREVKSEAFTAHPFRYSFHPVPSTAEGGYFINTISAGFGVNRNSANLALANEFMRFLVRAEELNLMAKAKRMVTPCADMSLDSVYAPFQKVSAQRFINLSDLGLTDAPITQLDRAAWRLTTGQMTLEEAVAAFGTLE